MTQPMELAGAWYGANTPRGSWVALYPTGNPDPRIQTSRGRLELPGQNVLYLDCADIGDALCIAGAVKIDDVDVAILWNGQKWIPLCPAYGTSPVAFGPDGTLYVSSVGAVDNVRLFDPTTGAQIGASTQAIGSRGIAAVDAAGVHPVDQWYGHFGLGEYVEVGGYRIGQGVTSRDGLEVAGRGPLVPDGLCTFIHAKALGDQFAVSTWKTTGRLVLLWPTKAQIEALTPRVIVPPIVIVPPVDKDKPKEKPVSLPDPGAVRDALTAQRAKHGATVSNDECVAMLNGTALQFPGMGLHRKDGENAGRIGNTSASRDVLRYLPDGDNFGYWSDVFGATGAGLAIPVAPEWKRSTDDRATFIAPVPAKDAPPVVVGGPPESTSDVEDAIWHLISQAVAPLKAEIAALQTQVNELKARPVGGGGSTFVLDGQRVSFVDDAGNVLSVRRDEPGLPVKANRQSVGPWEVVTVRVQP